jgi:hypothetical protein
MDDRFRGSGEGVVDPVKAAPEGVTPSGCALGLSGRVDEAPPKEAGCLPAEIHLVMVPRLWGISGDVVFVCLFFKSDVLLIG